MCHCVGRGLKKTYKRAAPLAAHCPMLESGYQSGCISGSLHYDWSGQSIDRQSINIELYVGPSASEKKKKKENAVY